MAWMAVDDPAQSSRRAQKGRLWSVNGRLQKGARACSVALPMDRTPCPRMRATFGGSDRLLGRRELHVCAASIAPSQAHCVCVRGRKRKLGQETGFVVFLPVPSEM